MLEESEEEYRPVIRISNSSIQLEDVKREKKNKAAQQSEVR